MGTTWSSALVPDLVADNRAQPQKELELDDHWDPFQSKPDGDDSTTKTIKFSGPQELSTISKKEMGSYCKQSCSAKQRVQTYRLL